MNNIKVFITGGTGDLGSALVKELLSRGVFVLTNGRDQTKADSLMKELTSEQQSRFKFIVADLSKDTPEHIASHAYEQWNGIDVLISNVAVFAFDKDLEEDEEKRNQLYSTNTGGLHLAEAVAEMVTSKKEKLILCDIGSTSVIADMLGEPFTDTYHYGKTKADVVRHSIELAHSNPLVTFRGFHPGSIDGKFAQQIANKYGDTYVTSPCITATYAIELFLKESPEPVIQEIFSSTHYFAWTDQGSWYGKESYIADNIEGLTKERIIKIPIDGKNSFRKESDHV